jgi:hypothetical protein
MNKEKYIHHQQQNWLSGATGFNAATAPAFNNRSELLADKADAGPFTYFHLVSGQWAQTPLRPNDELLGNTHRRR